MTNEIISICTDNLCRLFGTKIEINKAISIGGGCINNALLLKTNIGDFFLKWNTNCAPDMFIKEADGLNEMRLIPNTSIVIPKVIFAKERDTTAGCIILEYLQTAVNTNGYDEKLGRGIAELHNYKADKYGFRSSNFCGTTIQPNNWTENWPEFFSQFRIKYLIGLLVKQRYFTSPEVNIFEKLIEKIPSILTNKTYPSLIHGDLWSGNYMYTTNGPALIDPAAYYADREMELGMMQLFGGFNATVWEAYNEYLPLEKGWKERTKLYQLYHILNHYHLFGGSYGHQAISIAKYFTESS